MGLRISVDIPDMLFIFQSPLIFSGIDCGAGTGSAFSLDESVEALSFFPDLEKSNPKHEYISKHKQQPTNKIDITITLFDIILCLNLKIIFFVNLYK
jgi:hypothetical protein